MHLCASSENAHSAHFLLVVGIDDGIGETLIDIRCRVSTFLVTLVADTIDEIKVGPKRPPLKGPFWSVGDVDDGIDDAISIPTEPGRYAFHLRPTPLTLIENGS